MPDNVPPPKFPLTSLDIAEEKRRQLKQLFPEAFTEARDARTGELKHAIDWEKLKASLGEVLEKEGERFGLSWPGKSGLLKIIQQPSVGTLKPARAESVRFDETENLFIEGDNLEVLKLLQKSYFGQVKMIYIDPPYNTGNEFVYPDNFTETLETYLQYTGQVDARGRKFSTNAATEGRFHSKWLNMMYPRLFLARNLLREDGVIFISIDDNEASNLKRIMDEIFGEENFLSAIAWRKRSSPDARATIGSVHDTLLCYVRNGDQAKEAIGKMALSDQRKSAFSNPDEDPRGPWASVDMTGMIGRATKDQFFEIELPSGRKIRPPEGRSWGLAQATFEKLRNDDRIWFGKSGDNVPRIKNFLNESEGQVVPSFWGIDEAGSNDEASKEISELFGAFKVFDTPKPTRLIQRAVDISTKRSDDALILDFFSGSCTTAHAVLDLNKEDGGSRKFIMVQLPEPCDEKSEAFKAGYPTIADIGKERIRRVIRKIEEDQAGQLDFESGGKRPDLGFKVFKLSPSNFNLWEGNPTDADQLKAQLELHIHHLDPQATAEDILYELLLKAGFPLTTPVESIQVADLPAYSIAEGALIICLTTELTLDAIRAIAGRKPVQCICLDAAFHGNDQLKTNAVQTMESAEVQFRTV